MDKKFIKVQLISLKKTGNKVVDIPEGHLCCGSAGTYNLLQNDIARKLLKNKISNIEKVDPQIISTGNIGCITQIAQGTKIPILHTIEIIDWYTGGPKPEVLRKTMKKILITRKLMKSNEEYALKIFNVRLNKEDKLLTKDELISKK